MQIPRATKSNGVALTRVSAKALDVPKAPSHKALYASMGLTFRNKQHHRANQQRRQRGKDRQERINEPGNPLALKDFFHKQPPLFVVVLPQSSEVVITHR